MRRPSPALIVAICAVVLAGSGSAIGASLITSSRIRNGTIRRVDLSKSVRRALRKTGMPGAPGAPGSPGAPGADGRDGAPGADGSALAYARIALDGTADAANTKNIAVVEKNGTGRYCLDDTAGTAHTLVAMLDVSDGDSRRNIVSGTADPATVTANCPPPADIYVTVGDTVATGATDAGFYLAVIS